MDGHLFLRGFLLGFAIAAPVGPVGVLVIRRTLLDGAQIGFLSGMGAATADAAYGAIAAFGLTLISAVLMHERLWLQSIGGAVLLYLGVTLVLSKPAQAAAATTGRRPLQAYASVAALTLTNPATILSFLAAFAAFGVVNTHGEYVRSLSLVLGVFLGSCAWWALLTSGITLIRSRLRPPHLLWVNRVSGAALGIFGFSALLTAIGTARKTLA